MRRRRRRRKRERERRARSRLEFLNGCDSESIYFIILLLLLSALLLLGVFFLLVWGSLSPQWLWLWLWWLWRTDMVEVIALVTAGDCRASVGGLAAEHRRQRVHGSFLHKLSGPAGLPSCALSPRCSIPCSPASLTLHTVPTKNCTQRESAVFLFYFPVSAHTYLESQISPACCRVPWPAKASELFQARCRALLPFGLTVSVVVANGKRTGAATTASPTTANTYAQSSTAAN